MVTLKFYVGILLLNVPNLASTFTISRSFRTCPTLSALTQEETTKERLLALLSETPRNAATPSHLTGQILIQVRLLEECCPTETNQVLGKLSGTWELLWTTQDSSSPESKFSWINPLENQSYSNNPSGRADPVLPIPIQNQLERAGIIDTNTSIRSTQSIDLKKQRVRNVVTFSLGERLRASLTVNIDFTPDVYDDRRVNVKFQSCRLVLLNSPVDWNIPLGILGPTGWLRTSYIDDDLRITRGHKGSVFVLARPNTIPSIQD